MLQEEKEAVAIQRSLKTWRFGIAATALALAFASGRLLLMVTSPSEQMRIRNSLILRAGAPSDFSWKPGDWPAEFRLERGPLPETFQDAGSLLLEDKGVRGSAWRDALELAKHLASGPGNGSSIRSNTADAYRAILSERRGYCADYTQVFNGLAYATGIPVREWGMTFDGFGNDGHAFNEIFDSHLDKWIFVDSFYSFFVEDPEAGVPLSVLELREALQSAGPKVRARVVPIEPKRFAFRSSDEALDYYRRGSDQFFLIFGNGVFSYDRHPVIAGLGGLSHAVAQSVAIALGIYPKLVMIPSETNQQMAEDLYRKRNAFFALALLVLLLGLALAVEAFRYRRAAGAARERLG